jgi:hypothetical protein
VELVKVLINGLTSVVSDTSGTKQTANSQHLGDLLTGDFTKGESAFATAQTCCVSFLMPIYQRIYKLLTLHLFC